MTQALFVLFGPDELIIPAIRGSSFAIFWFFGITCVLVSDVFEPGCVFAGENFASPNLMSLQGYLYLQLSRGVIGVFLNVLLQPLGEIIGSHPAKVAKLRRPLHFVLPGPPCVLSGRSGVLLIPVVFDLRKSPPVSL